MTFGLGVSSFTGTVESHGAATTRGLSETTGAYVPFPTFGGAGVYLPRGPVTGYDGGSLVDPTTGRGTVPETLGSRGGRTIACGFGVGAACVPPDVVSGTDGVRGAVVCASGVGGGRRPPP
jgi:hypothetical protein